MSADLLATSLRLNTQLQEEITQLRGWRDAARLENERNVQAYDIACAERDALSKSLTSTLPAFEHVIAERDALRAHIEAIAAACKVAFCATTDPLMTSTLAGIVMRCKDALGKEQP